MLTLLIYLMAIINNIKYTGLGIGIVATIIMAIAFMYCCIAVDNEERDSIPFKAFKKYMWIPIIGLSLGIFVPNSTTLAAMYLVPKLVENQQLQQIPNKALEVLNLQLDKWVSNLTKDAKEKT